MPIKLHWFLPTAGDSRNIAAAGADDHHRPASFEYLTQVARAAEENNFHAVLTPAGTWCEDAWIETSALLPRTSRLKFLVAFRPGLASPTLVAQQAATYQRVSGGRLLVNIVTGGEDLEQRRFGDHLSKDERYARTDEFLQIVKGAWSGNPFNFKGEHYDVVGATVHTPPSPVPEIYFGGASPAAEGVAARHSDVYLTWGEPPAQVRERVERMREKAAAEGRELRFGIRLHAISRDRAEDAWAETDRLLEALDPKVVQTFMDAQRFSQSEGQRRMTELHGGRIDREGLIVSPNLWAGVGLVRAGAGTALVGSHEEVAERILEYHEIGFDEFILSGHPHVEEAYWVGEGVAPILRREGVLEDPAQAEYAPTAPQRSEGPSYVARPREPAPVERNG
ncbi:MAG: LLM class flavin-dependent oxidoreductase [Solirubrobacterales bacterium]